MARRAFDTLKSSSITTLLTTTPKRTFILFPLLAIVAQLAFPLVRFGAYNLAALPLLPLGYLQYRLCGSYIGRRGQGGHKPKDPPTRLVTSGPYRYVRNPMYIGHLIFLAGVTLALSSYVAADLLLVQILWLQHNVDRDEALLFQRYGEEYQDYKRAVPRWIPRPRHLFAKRSRRGDQHQSGSAAQVPEQGSPNISRNADPPAFHGELKTFHPR